MVEGKEDGYTHVMPFNPENAKQRWVWAHGNQIINVETGKALYAKEGRAWKLSDTHDFAIRMATKQGKALCTIEKEDGIIEDGDSIRTCWYRKWKPVSKNG